MGATASTESIGGRRRPRHRRIVDGATVLSAFVVALMAIPAQYVVAPLGAAGTPAQIMGMGMVLWWCGHALARPHHASPGARPVRRAMLFLLLAALASYVAGNLRPIDGVEARAADRGLLSLVAWCGIVLVASETIPTRARLEVLLRRLVTAGGLVASLGLVQFWTREAFTDRLAFPGLTVNSELYGVASRAGFARPAGTALHPIEFGVVLTMLLPLALHFALADQNRHRVARWYPVMMLAAAIPLSVSRSAIVCVSVALILMLPGLTRSVRRAVGVGAMAVVAAVYLVVPGMLGAILSLFTGIGTDDSAASRTGSYSLAMDFVRRSPLVGRGFMTFLPEYRILDNQFLLTLIELGVLGLLALVSVFGVGVLSALWVKKHARDQATRRLAQSLLAGLGAGVASLALFDGLSFPMVACLLFLLVGATGGLRRLTAARSAADIPRSALDEPLTVALSLPRPRG